jgi:preprotein translocase subunit SecE
MAGRPATKRTGPRRDRTEGKATIAQAGKTSVQAVPQDPAGPSGWTMAALKAYLQQVRLEMGRVTWPSRRELQAATAVVMMTLIVFAGYLGMLDFILRRVFR